MTARCYWCGRHVHRWKWVAKLCAWNFNQVRAWLW